VADAEAPPANPNDKPAAPITGTVALATRFCLEVRFACGMAAFLHRWTDAIKCEAACSFRFIFIKQQIARCFGSAPPRPEGRRCAFELAIAFVASAASRS
jgi:hypothetical protein